LRNPFEKSLSPFSQAGVAKAIRVRGERFFTTQPGLELRAVDDMQGRF
jgi:hypothetical protein